MVLSLSTWIDRQEKRRRSAEGFRELRPNLKTVPIVQTGSILQHAVVQNL